MKSATVLLAAYLSAASFSGHAMAETPKAEANWVRSDQTNAPPVSPVIFGNAKLYIHINCAVQSRAWSYSVYQIPATGPTDVAGQLLGTAFTFGGGNDPFVRDAVIDVPADGSKSYRLKVVPAYGGGAGIWPVSSPNVFTENEPRGKKELRRFNVNFRDHNQNIETWVDIHVMPR